MSDIAHLSPEDSKSFDMAGLQKQWHLQAMQDEPSVTGKAQTVFLASHASQQNKTRRESMAAPASLRRGQVIWVLALSSGLTVVSFAVDVEPCSVQ